MWRTGMPSYATHKCCLFCVASYHFGREALRVTVDEMHNIGLEIKCQAATWLPKNLIDPCFQNRDEL
jgi:hypothetical protein